MARLLRIRHICNDYLNVLDAFYLHKVEGDHEYLYETLIKIRTILYERFAVELTELRRPLNRVIDKLYKEVNEPEVPEVEVRKLIDRISEHLSQLESPQKKGKISSAVKYRESHMDRFERYFESVEMPLTRRKMVCFQDVVEIRPPVLKYLTALDKIFSSRTKSKTLFGDYLIEIKVDFYEDLIWHLRYAKNPLDNLINKLRIVKEDAGGSIFRAERQLTGKTRR